MQAYPRLKRLAVLAARDAGKSTPEVAKRYDVSESWVRRVVQERRELGKVGPYQYRRRDRRSASLSRRVVYMVMEDPRITVRELERVLATKLSINLLNGVKDEIDISRHTLWYGGLDTVAATFEYLPRLSILLRLSNQLLVPANPQGAELVH